MRPFPCLRKSLTLLTLLGVAAAHAQPLAPAKQAAGAAQLQQTPPAATGAEQSNKTAASQADARDMHQSLLPDMLENHPAVQAAEQQKQAAIQEVEGARWQYFPTPSIGVESGNQVSPYVDSKTRFARLQQPLWTGGRLTAQTARAQAQLEFAQAGWREQRHVLATRWLELWAEAVAASQRIEAFVESEALHQRYVGRVQARASEGQIAHSETHLSHSRLANVQAELELARAQQRQAFNKLRQMWGKPWVASEPSAWPPLKAAPAESSVAAPTEPATDHPVLQKSQHQIEMAQAEVDLARARLYPEIYARGEITRGDVTGQYGKAIIGMSASYGGGLSNVTAVGAAQNRVEVQRQDLETRRKDLQDQLMADQLQRQSQTQRAQQLQQALEAANAYLESSEIQFDSGRRSWQELMNSAREKAQLRAQLADSHAQAWLADQRLRLNTQGLESYLSPQTRP